MTTAIMALTSHHSDDWATIHVIRYLYPLLLFVYYGIAIAIRACALHAASSKFRDERARRKLIIFLEFGFLSTYVAEIVSFTSRAIVDHKWPCSQSHMIYLVFSTIIWSFELFDLFDSAFPVWYPHYGSWAIAAVAETALLVLYATFHLPEDPFTWAAGIVRMCRICLILSLPLVLFALRKRPLESTEDEESRPLLRNSDSFTDEERSDTTNSGDPDVYGAASPAQIQLERSARISWRRQSDQTPEQQLHEIVRRNGSWWRYAKRFSVFAPYLYPSGNRVLQLKVVVVILLSLAVCGLEVLVARQLGTIVDTFISDKDTVPWIQIAIFLVLRILVSRFGISSLQNFFWEAYDRFCLHALATTAFFNLTRQSDHFQDRSKLVEVHRSIEDGQAVRNLIRTVVSATIPRLAGLVASLVFLFYLFGAYLVLVVVCTLFLLLVSGPKLDKWKLQSSLWLHEAAKEHSQKAIGAVENWRSYLNLEQKAREINAYEYAVSNHVNALRRHNRVSSITEAIKNLIVPLGLSAACLIAGYQVGKSMKPVGNFVALVAYWPQLTACLSTLANFGGLKVNDLLQAENYLKLLQRIPLIQEPRNDRYPPANDQSGEGSVSRQQAQPRQIPRTTQSPSVRVRRHGMDILGGLALENGSPEDLPPTPTGDWNIHGIENLSLQAEGGSKVSLVGSQGDVTSNVLQLLVGSNPILASKVNIGDVSLQDMDVNQLRDYIGTISQDPKLLDDSILGNIREARLDATEDEIHEACNAAGLHDVIMDLSEKYDTIVHPSGGNISSVAKNLISIARVFLKNTKILVLESMKPYKDGLAEKHVSDIFNRLMQDRITFMNGQDLQGLITVDTILYFEDDRLMEVGDHKDLMQLGGGYCHFVRKHFAKDLAQIQITHEEQASTLVQKLCSTGLRVLNNHLKNSASHQIYDSPIEETSKSIQSLLDNADDQNRGGQGESSKGGKAKSTSEHNSTGSNTEPFSSLPAGINESNPSIADRPRESNDSASRSNIWKPDVPDFVPTSQQPARFDHQAESSTSLQGQLQQSRNGLNLGLDATKSRREKETWTQRREREKREKEVRKRGDAEKKAEIKMRKKAKKDDIKSIPKAKGRSHLAAEESGSSAQVASVDSPSFASMDGTIEADTKPILEKKKRTRTRAPKYTHGSKGNGGGFDNKGRVDFQKASDSLTRTQSSSNFLVTTIPSGKERQDHEASYRIPVYRRRAQSKSDPVGFAQLDGSDDQYFSAEASPSAKPASKEHRRVSAPNDPSTTDVLLSPQVQKRKRRQHGKKVQASGLGSSEIGHRSSSFQSNLQAQKSNAAEGFNSGPLTDGNTGPRGVHFEDRA